MAPQDSFIDEDDDTCPLCVEEFDLSDKNFRPCPCGYQVCQFCFNNIRNNMNGLCPACRRPYDDKTIKWRVVTPEEIAQFKSNIQKNAKKKADIRQKEAQKREVETLNRKHLSGLRVIQKNLVYVLGLSPGIREDEMLQTLRGDKYFGQYGKIIKIVVQKAKQGEVVQTGQSIGVYVTFERKEDAARCIAAVNGSQNGDRVLRAQLGTTKYCSAYLRNETCTNKQCMFLHEPGDNDDSYSRHDLSSINSVSTQRPLPAMASSSRSASRQAVQTQAPIQQAQPIAAATQPMARGNSKDGSDSGDGSALPSSASWANHGIQQRSRRGSHATSGAASSPAVSYVMPATVEATEEVQEQKEDVQESVEPAALPEAPVAMSTPKQARNVELLSLLKAINTRDVEFVEAVTRPDAAKADFPPLFDVFGGEKRRAMREQQEEARLQIEQEPQPDVRAVAEPSEEEEPESGSLQLGGEPEDREHGREGGQSQGFNSQRRMSTQLPIQRAPTSGPFGPSLNQNFTQNIGNLSSINGRTLTPQQTQQLQILKSGQPQHGFMDQFSSANNQGASLFQQQGHNRQSSRYSFANESAPASSSSVKPSANPKLMAQQSSMMPPSSQQGNQYYGSTMPGPPPGLKSTGTPPAGMFGQGHGFGGSMGGGSVFGGSQKDNNSDMLREMLRGRGSVGAGGSQIHDTGKLDLADPSILQARMHQQQQSNAGVGQGLFGGQAQEDQILPSLDEASKTVDQLVADSSADDIPTAFDSYDVSRSSTPSVPPGFGPPGFGPPGLPHAHPSPIMREDPIAKPSSRIIPNAAPFTPSRAASSAYAPRAATPLANVSVPPTPVQRVATPKMFETPTSQAKHDVKALATNSGLSKAIATQASTTAIPSTSLQPEEFPALEKGTPKMAAAAKVVTPVKSNKKATGASSASIVPTPAKTTEKRPTPGILNIAVPSKSIPKPAAAANETPTKSVVAPAAFPPLPTSTPTAAIQSPIPRTLPKTIRVVPTPKTELPPSTSTPTSTTSMFPPIFPPSRQPSLASASKLERPGSPTSEIISETASMTSASFSRANSPPPSKVGSAPVRTTTKSMQKKQRKEAQKEKFEAVAAKPEPEVEVAPIMGRKKKQKKEKPANSVPGGSTPAISRAPSPGLVEPPKEVAPTIEPPVPTSEKPNPPEKDAGRAVSKTMETKAKGKAKAPRPVTPEPVSMALEEEEGTPEKPIPTPASVFNDLLSAGDIPDPSSLNVLKAPIGINSRHELPADMQDIDQKLTITPEDRSALLSGTPVHKVVEGLSRIMLTPNGDCVRNLTPDEEERYLELQSRIAAEAGPTAFFSAKHHANNGFTLIGGRAVPNGPPAFFPVAGGNMPPIDPVSKIQRDEALSYINQYVLPSLSTNSQLEKALNANALDAEMMRTNESSTWASWGNDAMSPSTDHNEGPYGPSSQEGILATGLENMTAHFAVGREIERGQPLGNVSLLSLTESETAMQVSRKETEGFEKKLNQLLKKNRRLLLGTSH